MIIKRLSFVLHLRGVYPERPLLSSEAAVYANGNLLRREYKKGGYFVFSDIPEGEYEITVRSPLYQTETFDISVDYSDNKSARVINLLLNPSENNPVICRFPRIKGRAFGEKRVYIFCENYKLKTASDTANAGNASLKLFGDIKPKLPCVCAILGKTDFEMITLCGFEGDLYLLNEPLKHAYPRSSEVFPLIGVGCGENGDFFFALPPYFKPDKKSGKIPLGILSENGAARFKIQSGGITELGEIKFMKEG